MSRKLEIVILWVLFGVGFEGLRYLTDARMHLNTAFVISSIAYTLAFSFLTVSLTHKRSFEQAWHLYLGLVICFVILLITFFI